MSRTRIFLATLTIAQVKAIEITLDLKVHSAAQARAKMIRHQNTQSSGLSSAFACYEL